MIMEQGDYEYPRTQYSDTTANLHLQLKIAQSDAKNSQDSYLTTKRMLGDCQRLLEWYKVEYARMYKVVATQTVRPQPPVVTPTPTKEVWILRHADGTVQVTNELPKEPGTVVSARLFKGQ